MIKKYIFDTNIIIDYPNIIENTINSYIIDNKIDIEILIPITILSELDNLKNKRDIGYLVRNTIKIIYSLINNNKYKENLAIIEVNYSTL